MTEGQEELSVEKQSRRKKLGRAVLYLGFSIILVVFILSLSVPMVSSYSGVEIPTSSYSPFVVLFTVIGIVLIIAGLVAIILPEGMPKDGVWVMKVGPLCGNT
jgi:NADH:ubiquinone oxidoreductase subunit 6 (subunit J)